MKSTLGPKGMDKILQSASTGEIMVTNDGATILKSIALDNAAVRTFAGQLSKSRHICRARRARLLVKDVLTVLQGESPSQYLESPG